jgi:hypothetical protein
VLKAAAAVAAMTTLTIAATFSKMPEPPLPAQWNDGHLRQSAGLTLLIRDRNPRV